MATFCPEIEQIKDPATKQAIARKILEGLRDWFEVDETPTVFTSPAALRNWKS